MKRRTSTWNGTSELRFPVGKSKERILDSAEKWMSDKKEKASKENEIPMKVK